MGAIRPIFDFESVFDLDLTMIELIQEKFKGSKFFNSVMNEDPMTVRLLLRSRQEHNPLSIIINDEYKDSIDDLYEEILTKYKVRNIPLLVLENEEGNELWRHVGFITKDELTKELDKFKE